MSLTSNFSLTIVIHPTPAPPLKGRGERGPWVFLQHFVLQKTPHLSLSPPSLREGGWGEGQNRIIPVNWE